jgi:aminopeptidase N
MEAMYGADRAAMLDHLDRQGLLAEMKEFGEGSPETVLHINLAGRDPDDGMTSIPYDKGAAFLRMLEHTFGRERWDAYLTSYFDRHAFQPMTSEAFLADLRAHLVKGDEALEQQLQLDAWVYQPGLPSNATEPHSDAFQKVEQQAAAFAAGTPAAQLADLDRTFKLSEQGNSEVLFAWLRIAIRNQYEPALPALERFLTGQGRRKFLVPLYQDLMAQGAWGQQRARKIYQLARPLYHPVSVGSVDAIVK